MTDSKQKKIGRELWAVYKNLPHDLQQVILSGDTTRKIQDMGKRYALSPEKVVEFDDETGLVMLGFNHPRDFISNLMKRLGVDRETAKKIAEDVNKEIFQKVRLSLRKIHGITDQETVTKEESPKEDISRIKIIPDQKLPEPSKPKVPENVASKLPVSAPPKFPAPIKITEKQVAPVIPKELPKKELHPLEIRPVKVLPDSDGAKPIKIVGEDVKTEQKVEAPPKPTPPPPTKISPSMSVPSPKPPEIKKEPAPSVSVPEKQTPSPKIQVPNSPGIKDRGLEVMPRSPAEISAKIPWGKPPLTPKSPAPASPARSLGGPPPGLPFLDRRVEKKLSEGAHLPTPPVPPSRGGSSPHDPYREPTN